MGDKNFLVSLDPEARALVERWRARNPGFSVEDAVRLAIERNLDACVESTLSGPDFFGPRRPFQGLGEKG